MDVTTPVNCTCLGLRQAARAVTQMYDEALRPADLRGTQFSLLYAVDHMGPVGISDLAEMLVLDRTTLTRNLKPLVDRKLLHVIDGPDRRRRPIAITAKGRDVLARALPLWQEAQERLAFGLGRSRWQGLLGDLGDAVELARAE